jgi:hypothetical protein
LFPLRMSVSAAYEMCQIRERVARRHFTVTASARLVARNENQWKWFVHVKFLDV